MEGRNSSGNQVSDTLSLNELTVTNGRFITLLSFGAAFAGRQRFALESIADRCDLSVTRSVGLGALIGVPLLGLVVVGRRK